MMRKISAFLCAVMVLMSLMLPAMAAEQEQQVIDLGDGFYMVRTVVVIQTAARAGSTVKGSTSGSLYYEGVKIGTATLYAAFDISGSSAVAEEAYLTGSGMNGFTYEDGGTYCGGNRASGTAMFESATVLKQLPLSISCTPDGELY